MRLRGVGKANKPLTTKESTSFLKKRSKKLLIIVGFCRAVAKALGQQEFFCFFFSKKRSAFFPIRPLCTAAWD